MNIKHEGVLNIGCFGAIRNLKNHINQALAALKTAEYNKLTLHFHVNGTRSEGPASDSLLKNLRALFKDTKHKLVEHAWMEHKDFLELMKEMDISSQVSITETFNICVADSVIVDVPVVVSAEVDWLRNSYSRVPSPNDVTDIYFAYCQILFLEPEKYNHLLKQQRLSLEKYNEKAKDIWLQFIFNDREESF
jgi:hypothetical protein